MSGTLTYCFAMAALDSMLSRMLGYLMGPLLSAAARHWGLAWPDVAQWFDCPHLKPQGLRVHQMPVCPQCMHLDRRRHWLCARPHFTPPARLAHSQQDSSRPLHHWPGLCTTNRQAGGRSPWTRRHLSLVGGGKTHLKQKEGKQGEVLL